jgi:hypothetical protein
MQNKILPAVAGGALALVLGDAPGADATTGTEPGTVTRSHAVATWMDASGHVICTQRFGDGSQDRNLNLAASRCGEDVAVARDGGNGGTPRDEGSVTVTISQTGQSTLGDDLWTLKTWTYYYWSDKGTHALGVPGYGIKESDHADWRAKHREWHKKAVGVEWKG